MFGFKKESNYSKKESYKNIANNLICALKEEKKSVFAFVSSSCNLSEIVGMIGQEASKKVKTLVVNVCFDGEAKNSLDLKDVKIVNASGLAENFENDLLKYKSEFDLILVSLNSILTKAEALEYAKVCKEIIIVEKCTECYYADYENMLAGFKTAGINPRGVITVC